MLAITNPPVHVDAQAHSMTSSLCSSEIDVSHFNAIDNFDLDNTVTNIDVACCIGDMISQVKALTFDIADLVAPSPCPLSPLFLLNFTARPESNLLIPFNLIPPPPAQVVDVASRGGAMDLSLPLETPPLADVVDVASRGGAVDMWPKTEVESPKTDKSKMRKQKSGRSDAAKKHDAGHKLPKTLFKNVSHYINTTGMDCLLVTRNMNGSWNMLGTNNMEKKVLSMKPIIEHNQRSGHPGRKFEIPHTGPNRIADPGIAKSGLQYACCPLLFIIPRAMSILPSELQQGPFNEHATQNTPPKSSTKLFQRKGKNLNKPRETRSKIAANQNRRRRGSSRERPRRHRFRSSGKRQNGFPVEKDVLASQLHGTTWLWKETELYSVMTAKSGIVACVPTQAQYQLNILMTLSILVSLAEKIDNSCRFVVIIIFCVKICFRFTLMILEENMTYYSIMIDLSTCL